MLQVLTGRVNHGTSLGTGAGPNYWFPAANSQTTTVALRNACMCATAIDVSNLYVRLGAAPGAGKSRTFTIYKNGSDTGLSVTISDTATEGSDTTDTISFSAGDWFTLKHTSSGTPTNSGAHWSMDVDTGSTSAVGFSTTFSDFGGGLYYLPPMNCGRGTTDATGVQSAPSPMDMTITDFAVVLEADPGSGGDGITFTITKNGTATAATVSIIEPATSATISGLSVSVSRGDVLEISSTAIVTPIGQRSNFGMAYTPGVAGESVIGFVAGSGASDTPSGSATQYSDFGPITTGTSFVWQNAPFSLGTSSVVGLTAWSISKLLVDLTNAPTSGKSWTFGIYDSVSGARAPSVTIADAATSGGDTTNTAALSAGSTVGIRSVPSGTPADTGKMSVMAVQTVGAVSPFLPLEMPLPRYGRWRPQVGHIVSPAFPPFPPPGPPLPDGASYFPHRTPAALVRPPLNRGFNTTSRPEPVPPAVPPYAPIGHRTVELDTNPSDIPGINSNPGDTITLDPTD